jgi:hypothetical protein
VWRDEEISASKSTSSDFQYCWADAAYLEKFIQQHILLATIVDLCQMQWACSRWCERLR